MIAAAKAKSSRGALDVVRFGLQMHGAMGYADEHEIGLYWKRALVLAALYGSDANHLLHFSQLTWDAT
jgi:alkylation response protein AidB-like acyl-CoA dehydrogenase